MKKNLNTLQRPDQTFTNISALKSENCEPLSKRRCTDLNALKCWYVLSENYLIKRVRPRISQQFLGPKILRSTLLSDI